MPLLRSAADSSTMRVCGFHPGKVSHPVKKALVLRTHIVADRSAQADIQ